jgi:hypothetical protein
VLNNKLQQFNKLKPKPKVKKHLFSLIYLFYLILNIKSLVNAIAAMQQQQAVIAAVQAQQAAAIQGQTAATYTAGPTAYHNKPNLINPIQQPQQQIIYQAAPQPASANAANKVCLIFFSLFLISINL